MPREEFTRRFKVNFFDPAYETECEAIARLEAIAWDVYEDGSQGAAHRQGRAGIRRS